MGWGSVGTRDPPPYFWVEELKKRGISLIRESGRAQFRDLDTENRVLTSALKNSKICKVGSKKWYGEV